MNARDKIKLQKALEVLRNPGNGLQLVSHGFGDDQRPPKLPPTCTLDKFDLKLLDTIAKTGPRFMTNPSHEHRAFRMYEGGLLTRKNAVYKMGPSSVEYRWQYAISDAGRAALAPQRTAGEDGNG